MKADFFAPGRLTDQHGERFRFDPDCSSVILSDYDVLSQAETVACQRKAWELGIEEWASEGEPSPFNERMKRANSDYLAAKKNRSGTKWTEQDYSDRGIELLHLRMKPETHEPLDELCELWGATRGEAVKRAIDEAHARHVAPYAARRGVEQTPDESFEQTKPPMAVEGETLDGGSGRHKTDKSK